MSTRIKARPRGPLSVKGDVELIDAKGRQIDVAGRRPLLLCRCGASSTAPLCDGSHQRIGFEAPAPEEGDAD